MPGPSTRRTQQELPGGEVLRGGGGQTDRVRSGAGLVRTGGLPVRLHPNGHLQAEQPPIQADLNC